MRHPFDGPFPDSNTESLSFKVSSARDKQIREAARAAGLTLSQFLRDIVDKAIPPER